MFYLNLKGICMPKLALQLFLTAITFSAVNCYASVGEVKDTTTCYVFKKDKLVAKSKCNYHANVGAASDIYAINEYYYTIPKIGKITTIDNMQDGSSDANGNVTYKDEVHTIDKKPSFSQSRHPKTLKVITTDYNNDNRLDCSVAKDKSIEICTPPSNNY